MDVDLLLAAANANADADQESTDDDEHDQQNPPQEPPVVNHSHSLVDNHVNWRSSPNEANPLLVKCEVKDQEESAQEVVTDQPVAVIHARGLELKSARLDRVPESDSVDGVALSNFKVVLSCNIERELAIEVKSQLGPETELIGLDRADEVSVGVECASTRFVMRL